MPARFKGGDIDCLSYLTYFIIFIVYIISFVCIYNTQASLLGVLLLYLVNIVYSIFVIKDIGNPVIGNNKSNQIIAFILFSIFAMNAISSSLIINNLRLLNAKYSIVNEQIKLSGENKKILSIYVACFISTVVFLWVLTSFYFIEPNDTDFFSFQFINRNMIVNDSSVEINPFLVFLSFIIKISTSVAGLSLSGFMVYLSTKFKYQMPTK